MFRKSIMLFSVILMALLIYLMGCEEDKDEAKEKKTAVITYNISGRVVDNENQPVSGANVTYTFGNKQGQATTDASGVYSFIDLELGVYSIDVSKSGFTFGRTFAVVSGNGSIVSDVVLKSFTIVEDRVEVETTAEGIRNNGINIEAPTEATVSLGGTQTETKIQTVSASIPKDTEIMVGGVVPTEPVTLAVAPLEINEIPPPPLDEMPLGAAVFEPQNATFDKPVQIKMPVDIKLPPGIQIPLKKYVAGEWKEIGTVTIDETGLGADAEVTEFGQLAVQPKVDYSAQTESVAENIEEETEIPQDKQSIEKEISEELSFPGGLPEGITEEYAKSLILKMEGITLGTTSVVIDLPKVETVISKPASPLASNNIEPFVNRCVLKKYVSTETKVFTFAIMQNGSIIYTFTITYTIVRMRYGVTCTQVWVEHIQGS